MHDLTKKRAKAAVVDSVISTAVSLALEPLLRKKIKNEAFLQVAAPTLVFWGLEYVQLRLQGQTLGQKAFGIKVESEDGNELTDSQILKRVLHRDTISPLAYLRDREKYADAKGEKFSHDAYAHTVVKEQ
ncbi:RDD family protein [Planococcus ruber]|uniref:RDD family protein n=1 Tax=Planococcus ruber TaxID=2027871 RepID=UPI001FEEE094|nr:RDD family protein [Planococcus ruber]MCJ1907791.1 RDD family protein [Planococcus ruber]